MSARASISESADYGAIWTTADADLGDRFEDFLTERCFVLFQTRFENDEVSFLFGQASSANRVRELYERFLSQESGT
jgi:hypothetical protein